MVHTITIVRHGETDFNRQHLIHTTSPGTINDTGREQAKKLGQYLSNEKYTKIYSSDLQRCLDTAEGVLKHLKNPQPELISEKRLRERDFGSWDGRPSKDIFIMAKERGVEPKTINAPDGQTFEESTKIVVDFLSEIFVSLDSNDENDENILMFSHGLTIQQFLRHLDENKTELYELENFAIHVMQYAGNTAWTKFVVGKIGSDGRRKLSFISMHDQSHLGSLDGALYHKQN